MRLEEPARYSLKKGKEKGIDDQPSAIDNDANPNSVKPSTPHTKIDTRIEITKETPENLINLNERIEGGAVYTPEQFLLKVESALGAENNKPKPIWQGHFGNIYKSFKGKAKEAFDFLAKNKGGDLIAVFHRDGVGDIDLIWGDKTGGLAHILDKHVGGGRSFADVNDIANSVSDIINQGTIHFENGDKAVLKKGNQLVTIRKNVRKNGKKIADKNWILTAYDLSASDNVSAITTTNQGQAAPTTNKSFDKVSVSSSNSQENEEFFRPEATNAEWAEGINPELQEKYGKKNRYKLWQGEGEITQDNIASALYMESGIYLNELRKLSKLFGGFDGKLNDAQVTIENAKKRIEILDEYKVMIVEGMMPNATKPAQEYLQGQVNSIDNVAIKMSVFSCVCRAFLSVKI